MFQFKNPSPIPNHLNFETIPKFRIEKMVEKELKEYNHFLNTLEAKESNLFVDIARLKADLTPIKEKAQMLSFLKSIEPTYHMNTYEFSEQLYALSQDIEKLEHEIYLHQNDINATQARIHMTNEKIKLCARILECL